MIELNVGDFFLYEDNVLFLKDYSIVLNKNGFSTLVVKGLSEKSNDMVGNKFDIYMSRDMVEKVTDPELIKELQSCYDKLRIFE